MLAGEGMSDIDEIPLASDVKDSRWLREMIQRQGKHWNPMGD